MTRPLAAFAVLALPTLLALVGSPSRAQDGAAERTADPAPDFGPKAVSLAGPVTIPMDLSLVKPGVEVTVNGKGPFRFLLDTGASAPLIINDDLVAELGLATSPGPPIGDPANPQAIRTMRADVDRLALGDAVFEDVVALSWDRSSLYSGDDAPRGIVGYPLFRELLLTLDYPAKKMTVAPGALPTPNGTSVVAYKPHYGLVTIPIDLAGQTYDAFLDTGSMASITLPAAAADALPLKSEPTVVGHGRTVNSSFEITAAQLDGVARWGPATLRNPELTFTSVDLRHVVVGSQLMQQFRLTFDQARERLQIEPGPATDIRRVAPPKRRSYGLMVNPGANPPEIRGVVPDSPAARAGLAAGDVLVAINGTPVAEMGAGDMSKAFRASPVTLRVRREGVEREVRMTLE